MLVYSADHGHTVVDEWWLDEVQIEETFDSPEETEEDTFSGLTWDYWL